MKNYVQDGKVIDKTLAAIVASGGVQMIGAMAGVAQKAGAIGDVVPFAVEGVFDLPYGINAAIDFGDTIYWDAGNDRVTKTAGVLPPIGIAVAAALANAATVRVRLCPSVPTTIPAG